ncbi:hypothetical protein [Serratia symbiotica]|uniref:hypothetical protein n=1 Tax=Serratia symbiotica TaxID=138074 RepID=UPI0034640D83
MIAQELIRRISRGSPFHSLRLSFNLTSGFLPYTNDALLTSELKKLERDPADNTPLVIRYENTYTQQEKSGGAGNAILIPKDTLANIRREGNLDGLEKPEELSATLILNLSFHDFERRTTSRT